METGSILINQKRKHFTKRQTRCRKCFGAQALKLRGLKEFMEVYIDNEVYLLSYITFIPPCFWNFVLDLVLLDGTLTRYWCRLGWGVWWRIQSWLNVILMDQNFGNIQAGAEFLCVQFLCCWWTRGGQSNVVLNSEFFHFCWKGLVAQCSISGLEAWLLDMWVLLLVGAA